MLLDAFDEGHRRLSLAALVYRSGLARSTAHRTAAKLIELGWLQRQDGKYMVGEHLFEVASLAPSRYELRDAVLPYMQDIHEATRLTFSSTSAAACPPMPRASGGPFSPTPPPTSSPA
jgi:DNA-binding IclR family transcriptional regulator